MENVVFFYKENVDDRDCVKYIEVDRLGQLECGHYFPGVNVEGFNYSESLGDVEYGNITTILTENEIRELYEYSEKMRDLGYSIGKGDARYKEGIAEYDKIEYIIDKLYSQANSELYDKIMEEEKCYIKDCHDLTDDEVNKVSSISDYFDRGIIAGVWDSVEDLFFEWRDMYPDITLSMFENEVKEGNIEGLVMLEDGRVVELS